MRLPLRLFVPFALVLGAAAPVRALVPLQQSPAADSADAASKRKTPRTLDAVRVTARRARGGYAVPESGTATRSDLPLRDTPRSVSIVTQKLIADQSMQTMSDVMRYVPGVSMAAGEGHRDAPTIRGNNTTADFFIDGARDDAQYLRDLYNAERVEVLKGPEALLFGRGGGGGIINRVTKKAAWAPVLSLTTEGGSFDHKRALLDADQPLALRAAGRVTGVYENSGGFRDAATLTRYGVNPTAALLVGERTLLRVGYELFDDRRRVDRGIPSFAGRPAETDLRTFFGNPEVNHANAHVNIAKAAIEHRTVGGLQLHNSTTWADYDKFYQNTYPGPMNAAGTQVALSAYNHAIVRRNLITINDVTGTYATGAVRHAVIVGVDVTRQHTDQVRLTGYFGDSAATVNAPITSPTVATPVVFRASASDADNRTIANDAAVYVQDQVALTPAWLVIGGARYERFGIDYRNNRSGQQLSRTDRLVSPRAGLVFKPSTPLALYASYGVSHLPGSGDQFTSLTVTSATLEPERFTNREIGAKWELASGIMLNTAVYRLDRTNTTSPDPVNSARVVQTGAQRTTGWELGANGNVSRQWQFAGGFTAQQSTIASATTAAKRGATVALVPHTSAALWNRYQMSPRVGVGLGVIRQGAVYAAVDNTVTLPAFTRADLALYAAIRPRVAAQVNIENAFDARYFATSQGNNNIMPGAPRTLRLSITASR